MADARVTPTPPLLSTTVALVAGTTRSRGDLRIKPGRISVDVGRLATRVFGVEPIHHTATDITMACARVALPWYNTALLLDDETRTIAAIFPGVFRPRFRRALSAAGFTLVERKTWLSLGQWGLSSKDDSPERRGLSPTRRGLALLGAWLLLLLAAIARHASVPMLVAGSLVALVAIGSVVWRSER